MPTRKVRCALPLALMLTAAPAAAQPFECHPIRQGESAIRVALRLTGDSRNAYQTWFQIKNASSRFIPKSQYNRIRPGWSACVIRRMIPIAPPPRRLAAVEAQDSSEPSTAPVTETLARSETLAPPGVLTQPAAALAIADSIAVADEAPRSVPFGFVRAIRGGDLLMIWLGAAVAVPWFAWRFVDDYLVRRKTASIVMKHFADRFVGEFERPLVRYHGGDRAVRTEVRYRIGRRRLDILLAPGAGRRYPNLSDHKQNVEYDVARVIYSLGDKSFASGPLYTQSGWVVVPLKFEPDPTRRRRSHAPAKQQQTGAL